MTFDEYLQLVTDTAYNNPDWREGQTAFNVLTSVRPELAEAVRGRTMDLDPFYIYDNLERFYDFLRANWEPAPKPV